ncbi:LL-diaminopimelate aminotransferase [Calderihabitans maritimus]|uniref:LL-diaminopimelate aminotransferase n=1 Tax=Calderihabitans maritimus TaxID=1246530 RepID=A0A1Z5HX06_9FIRM|nr:LL-diaminopimelate aminotransferase [Calderihabitans maritimus]GAW93948.1 LL-diaminopimelate aminotransferase [Calderihabitans maritimus]
MQQASRLRQLPPYLFARIEKKIEEMKERGVDIISLGIGDPDRPTPQHVIEKLAEQAQNPENHRYPTSVGMLEYRKAVAEWYERRFGVSLDPKSEVVTLIGSKEGIGHISFCYVDPGDINLVPDPAYPVYGIGTLLAGGEPYLMPLREENGFLPDLESIPSEVARKAKLMFLNYPNNPTGALADEEFFRQVVEFAKNYDLIVCHDAAYSEITFDGYQAPSFLQVEGAKEVGIEFNSLSKPFNMTGWRIGWAVGNSEVIEALGRLKSNLDSGAFQAIQYAAIEALRGPQDAVRQMQEIYRERRDLVVEGLNSMGWNLKKPKATFYVWAPVPKGYTSSEFAEMLIEKAGVIVTPGIGYGQSGEGYFRIALCLEKDRIQEALERMKKALGKVEF